MYKNWGKNAKWPNLRKSARATNARQRNGLANTPARFARANQAPGAWPVAFDAGPSQTLPRRTLKAREQRCGAGVVWGLPSAG